MPGASIGQCAHRERVRSRYAFRSPEKVALQEIGPRFTLKLRYIKKGLPAVKNLGAPSKPLEFDAGEDEEAEPKAAQEEGMAVDGESEPPKKKVVPPSEDEYIWIWKVSAVYVLHVASANISQSRSWRLPDGRSSCRLSVYIQPVHDALPRRIQVHRNRNPLF